MASTARKLLEKRQEIQQPKRKKAVKKKSNLRFSKFEKFTLGLFMCVTFVACMFIIKNQSELYTINRTAESLKISITHQQKINNEFEVQVADLSNYDRILQKAKELGLDLHENNVKVVD